THLHYAFGQSDANDRIVFGALNSVRGKVRNGVKAPRHLHDPGLVLNEMRLFKQPYEIELMQKAADISAAAHCELMKQIKPGMHEYEAEAIIEHHFRRNNSRMGYPAIVGGGNSAVEEALYLSNLAAHVTVIHRRDSFRAERVMQQRLMAKSNVTIMWDTVVDAMLANEGGRIPTLGALQLRHARTGEITHFQVDGAFVAIGHDPATSLFRGQLAMDAEGYLVTEPGTTRTSIPGVFAAGDVADKIYRQAVTAAGTGCMAALDAEKYLAHLPAPVQAVAVA
ncbi:MAG: FAD-dependent oxidoreductase, partial [Pseudomonadota bacterium]